MAYRVSTEVLPSPEGTVYGLAVWNDDIIISGSDDNMLTIWKRAGKTNNFGPLHTITDHMGAVRAITIIPAGQAGFTTGGFATGCADKVIRLYSFDADSHKYELVRSLVGHSQSVLDLAWSVDGDLLSGSWDGTARVWDIAEGKCTHVLQHHENGTCVIGLPNGDIVVGSTGRKDGEKHVDYKIRVWRLDTSGGPPAYVTIRTIEDHEQAVRDLALLPGNTGYVSVGNDGMLAVRNIDHSVAFTFFNPMGPEDKPFSIFRVAVLPDGRIATASEDQTIRIYCLDGSVSDFTLPGTPWAVAGLFNGDLAVGCGQAGRSKKGHVYLFSARPEAAADDMTTINFATDMEPPKKSQAGAGSAGGSSSSMKVSGPYEARAGVDGTSDGQYGFFSLPDGQVMVCTWSAVAGAWVDVGTMEGEGSTGGEDGETGGSKYDYNCAVTLDTAHGMRSMNLTFNEGDDPVAVATNFCSSNAIPLDNVDEITTFITKQKMQKAAQNRVSSAIRQYKHFPSTAFIDMYSIDFKKVAGKLMELNTKFAGSLHELSSVEIDLYNSLVATLEATTRYHASAVSRPAVKLLLGKLSNWPVDALLPVVDSLRILVLHPDGAEATAEIAGTSFITAQLDRIRSLSSSPDARAVILLTARTLFNSFRNGPLRNLLMKSSGDVMNVVADLLQHNHATVRFAATVLLHNMANEFLVRRRAIIAREMDVVAAGAGASLGVEELHPLSIDDVKQLAALVIEGFGTVVDEDAVNNLIVTLGTCASIHPEVAQFVRDLNVDATLGSLPAKFASPGIREGVVELRGLLSSTR